MNKINLLIEKEIIADKDFPNMEDWEIIEWLITWKMDDFLNMSNTYIIRNNK